MNKTLITSWEVVKYGPVQKDFPAYELCNHIKRAELKAFSKCYLGLDFYNDLLNDLTPIDAEDYDASKTYSKGSVICYEGCVLTSVENNNTTHPDDNEKMSPKWVQLQKFKSKCFNDFWNIHLKYWLSLEVLFTSIRYITYKAGSKGLVTIKDENTGISTVNHKDFVAFKKELKNDADDQLELMFDWLLSNQQSCNFNINKIKDACNQNSCNAPKVTRRRRFYFKHK